MDDSGTLTMSAKERNRLEILGRVLERRPTRAQAAEQPRVRLADRFPPRIKQIAEVRAASDAHAAGRRRSATENPS